MSRRLRRTKIATTLDPATDHDNNLGKAIAVGANAVCMNFSHGSPEDYELRADKARETATKLGRYVVILGDLQGPKVRVFTPKEGRIFLNAGDRLLLDANLGKGEGDKEKVDIDYRGLSADIMPGDILLLDDGRVQPKVLEVQGTKVSIEVTVGGPLSNNEDINKLDDGSSAETLTEKDKADVITVTQVSVDYLAIPFPCYGEDLNYVHRLAYDAGCDVKIVAKVEHAEAVCDQNTMDNIILASDVVMVVRNDLGVEIGDPELVDTREALVRRVRQLDRTVTTATQMTESMITNPMPARTEATDVANAVPDGIDAVMLSAETAAGQYPTETITAIARVYLDAEKIPSINVSKHHLDVQFDNVEEAIAMSAMYATNHLKGITVTTAMTESGRTALMTSRISSGLPIFAIPHHEHILNLTSLYHGVTPARFDNETDGVVATNETMSLLRDEGYLVSGDLVIVTQDDMVSAIGSAGTARILTIE